MSAAVVHKHFEIPAVLDEDLFPIYKSYRDLLLDLYNDEDPIERKRWQRILNNPANELLDRDMLRSLGAGMNLIIYIDGERGIGKSYTAIAIAIRIQELYSDLGVQAEIVWTENYVDTNRVIMEAEHTHKILIIVQDENPKAKGDEAITGLNEFFNLIDDVSRYKRHCIIICSPKFRADFKDRMDCRLRVVARNNDLLTSLSVMHTGFNVEKGYVTTMRRLDHPEEYAKYEAFQKKMKDKVAADGGAVSAQSMKKFDMMEQQIWDRIMECYADEAELEKKQFDFVVTRYAIPLHSGRPSNAMWEAISRRWEAYAEKRDGTIPKKAEEKPVKIEPETNDRPKQTLKERAPAYSKRGHKEEDTLWEDYLPAFFKGTGARIIKRGEPGHCDGLIKLNGTTYVCDSKAYRIPLTVEVYKLRYRKIMACFTQVREELDRGEAKNVVLAVMFHETNRNLWTVTHVPEPLGIKRDTKDRPKGSLPIKL